MAHIPVLLEEVLQFLKPEAGTYFIDATIDGGGHAREILKRMSMKAILVGIDQDTAMITELEKEWKGERRLKLKVGNFKNLEAVAKEFSDRYNGILFDLGMSSLQLETSGRGFSFQKDEPLLMTYESRPSPDQLTAAVIVNTWSEREIEKILKEFGEERYARRIAKAIIKARKKSRIISTRQLVKVIEESTPRGYHRQSAGRRIHPATCTFQALRIAVNDELAALETGIQGAWKILREEGRLVVIAFHSLEDRIVKHFFQDMQKEGGEILTKKPVTPSAQEIRSNPRARSAKLRAITKK